MYRMRKGNARYFFFFGVLIAGDASNLHVFTDYRTNFLLCRTEYYCKVPLGGRYAFLSLSHVVQKNKTAAARGLIFGPSNCTSIEHSKVIPENS